MKKIAVGKQPTECGIKLPVDAIADIAVIHSKNIMPGEWRVDVETESGKTLSRMKFEAITVDSIHVDLVRITR